MAKVAEKDLLKQIDDINIKLDTILECALTQKQRSERMDGVIHCDPKAHRKHGQND